MAEKGIELKITATNAQARKGLGEVASELDRMGLKQTEVARAAQQAGGLINSTSHSIRDGIISISTQLDAAQRNLLAFLGVQQGLAGAKELAALADGYRNLQGRIGLVVGEGEQLADTMAKVSQVALKTYSDLTETGNLVARVTRVGKEAGLAVQEATAQALALTKTVNQSIQLGGASADASKAAITQLIQGLQSGVLRGDEFNSVMEQAPRLAQALADGLGVTTGELRKMAEAGTLTSATIVAALQRQSDAVEAEFSKLPVTVDRAMQNLRTSFTQYVAQQDEAHGITGKTAEAIGLLARNLDTVADAMLHAGQTFGAWKALNMAQSWIAAKMAIEQETAATVANTGAKAASAVAARSHAMATRESAAALSAHAIASRAASAAIAQQRLELEASRAATAAHTATAAAGAAQAGGLSGALRGLAGTAGAAVRALAPLALIDFALNFKQYGTWIGEAVAKLMGYKDRSAELAEQEKVNAKIAEQAAADRRAMALATQEAIDKQFELSRAAGDAVGKFQQLTKDGKAAADAVGEVTKNFDLTKLQGINDFAATLDKLAADGKVNAGEFRAAWAEALDGKDLVQFETMARAAFDGSAREAERLAQLTDVMVRQAVQRTGVEYDVLAGKMGAAARSAVNDTDTLIRGLEQLKAQGIDAGRALEASIGKALDTADSQQAIDTVIGQIESLREELGTPVTNALLERARERAEELGDALDKARPGINSLREAMGKLGVETDAALKKSAGQAKDAYDAIVKSGKASQRELAAAFKGAADAAIKAAGGVAPTWVRLEAAARGYRLEVDAAGRAHLEMGDKALTGAEKVEAAFARMGVQTKAEMDRAAKSAKDDYNTILFSGQATSEGLEKAFKTYAESAIAANGGVASEFLEAEAAHHGLAIAYDNTGKAVVRSAKEMGDATQEAMQRGNEAIEGQMGYLDRLKKRNAEVQSALKTDANGYALNEAGQTVVAAEDEASLNQRVAKLFGEAAIGNADAIKAANIKSRLDAADKNGVHPVFAEYFANLRREYERLAAQVTGTGAVAGTKEADPDDDRPEVSRRGDDDRPRRSRESSGGVSSGRVASVIRVEMGRRRYDVDTTTDDGRSQLEGLIRDLGAAKGRAA